MGRQMSSAVFQQRQCGDIVLGGPQNQRESAFCEAQNDTKKKRTRARSNLEELSRYHKVSAKKEMRIHGDGRTGGGEMLHDTRRFNLTKTTGKT